MLVRRVSLSLSLRGRGPCNSVVALMVVSRALRYFVFLTLGVRSVITNREENQAWRLLEMVSAQREGGEEEAVASSLA